MFRVFAPIALAAALAGCATSSRRENPTTSGPAPSLPPQFAGNPPTGSNVVWKLAQPGSASASGWWAVLNAPDLTRVVELASTSNQNLRASLARFDQARALRQISRAELYPQLTVDPGITRQRTSANIFDRGTAAGVSHTYNNFILPLDASWEIDLWGRVRRLTEAANARLDAAADDVAASRLVVRTEAALLWVERGSLENELRVVDRTVETYSRSLTLTRDRRRGGIATDLDVAQAETQLKSVEAQRPALQLRLAKNLDALALLCGVTPDQLPAGLSSNARLEVPTLEAGVPSALLERRPDVAAAERRMAAANAEIGAARAAFYPSLRLHGAAGFQSLHAGALFDWPSRLWSIGPSIELPIFTGGRLKGQLALRRAAHEEETARYRQTVLTAFREVEDNLAAQRLLAEQWEFERQALQASQRTLEIATNRYKAGLVTFLEVAAAQTSALNLERDLVRLQSERLLAAIGLIRALGGGWVLEGARP